MGESFEKVLEGARSLSPEEQQKLVSELTLAAQPQENGQVRSLYDALQARGLIGCLKDAPSDLSTNPKYMEGFGQHVE